MFPVCSLLVISESPLNFLLQQDRIKTCNSKPNSFFKKLFKGYWRCLAFLKKSGQLPEPSNSPRNWENWKAYQNRTLPKKEFFGGKWREYGRNNRKYPRLGKSLQERASLNTISWDFPRGEIILGVLRCPALLKNESGQLPEPSNSPRNWKNWRTYQNQTFWGKWREYGRNQRKYERVGKSPQERHSLNTISLDFPRGRNYSRGTGEITCISQKSKWAAASWKKESINTERFPKKSSLEGNEGNMGEIRGNMKG